MKKVSFQNQGGVAVHDLAKDQDGNVSVKNGNLEDIKNVPDVPLKSFVKIGWKKPLPKTKMEMKEEIRLEENVKVFTEQSEWLIVLGLDCSFKNFDTIFSDCTSHAEKFVSNILKQNLLSFNCRDLNEILSLKNKDPKLLVIKFENENVNQEELLKIILPIFLVMSNIFTPSKSEEQSSRDSAIKASLVNWRNNNLGMMLDDVVAEVEEVAGRKTYTQEVFDQAKKLHQNILSTMQSNVGNKKERGESIEASFIIELMGDLIADHINSNTSGKMKASHIKPKIFESIIGKGKIFIAANPSKTISTAKQQLKSLLPQSSILSV